MRLSLFHPLIFLGTLLFLGAGCTAAPSPTQTDTPSSQIEQEGLQEQTVVRIDSTGYHPASITVRKGQTILWVNEDLAASHWPASDPHPTHSAYPGFDPKTPIAPGNIWLFRFDTPGTWQYHDHLNAEKEQGYRVTVTE
jgi:plastocyanin